MNVEAISGAREQVVASIQKAAKTHQVDFDYLLTQAKVESSLNPDARAKTSSATGLFQFTSSTWLNVVRRHGNQVGLAAEAAELNSPNVSSASISKVLALRNEPSVSAELAARFALDNAKALNSAGHANVGPTELYLAHFLGAGGATTFLNGLRDTPEKPAATALPQAAAANSGIFYNAGAPRSYREIYDRFAQKFAGAATTAVAGLPGTSGKIATDKLKAPSLTDRKIAEIATRVLSENGAPGARIASTNATDAASTTSANIDQPAVSKDALQQYLKNFNLVDHERGMMPGTGHAPRDASRGAGSNADPAAANDIEPLAQGSRLVLKAVAPQDENGKKG